MSDSKYSAYRGALGLHEADFAKAEGVVARAFSGYAYMRYVAGGDAFLLFDPVRAEAHGDINPDPNCRCCDDG